ncbi:thioredoxin domain-containing protein 11 isoform X5 [Hermetia illucens]|uniref:thioredoxin domain-containing protein 11 isoform X5 n=1 Tax=Hermetia illucens TaxID=343691 RepID=UPI0018CC5C8B|nr:thioredoxin domain-containing protein 11 isoform X5 [Hermetia illucens]
MSSEISSSLSAENIRNAGTSERRPSRDSVAQSEEDLGVEGAHIDTRSDNSELLSETSESAASSIVGDDGSTCSVSGVSIHPEPIALPSQIADSDENERNIRDDDGESDISHAGIFLFDLRKMVMQYSKELICLFALALTTYATLQNGPPKISRAPPPTPLFSKDSLVQEWPGGHLNVIQSRVSMSELSLVLFYAPWCAESQFAKAAYEEVANKYHKQAYFAAVNCWQPGGECRLQYAKVQTWPVLMVYFPQGVAVQYNGPWLVQPLSRFMENLMKPYRRISNRNELNALRMDSNSVVVGFFSLPELRQSDFFIFVQSAIKWLEKDPYQDVQFAVVTGESCREFDIVQTPAVKLYNWNETLDMELTDRWSVDNITKWLKDRLNSITTWIHPPGKKSATLAPYLKAGPTVIFFTPKDYYTFNKDGYHMLKQVALEYNRCKNDTQSTGISGTTMHLIREENLKRYLKMKSTCLNISEPTSDDNEENFYKSCTADEPNITFSNILNNSKFDKLMENSESYCYIETKAKNSKSPSCKNVFNKSWRDSFKEKLRDRGSTPKSPLSMLRPEHDNRSAMKLLEQSIINLCHAHRLSDNSLGDTYFGNEKNVDLSEFDGKAREFNRTLSFILLDSIMYKPIASRLGIDITAVPKNSSMIIIDDAHDSTYHLKGEISTKSVISFIKNFISGTVRRKFRSTKRVSPPSTGKEISIREITSNEFREYLRFSRKTIVVLFYSVQCALCSLFSQTLLIVSKILQSIDIDFLRIDSDLNDFQWHYTMDTYPTLIIFPRNRTSESRIFPHAMEVNISNILGFIIANLSPEERLQAIYESCQFRRASSSIQNCLYTMRLEISDNISRNLRNWRHYPTIRNEVLRKLQILQRIYLSSFQVDVVDDLELLKNNILQFKQLMRK